MPSFLNLPGVRRPFCSGPVELANKKILSEPNFKRKAALWIAKIEGPEIYNVPIFGILFLIISDYDLLFRHQSK